MIFAILITLAGIGLLAICDTPSSQSNPVNAPVSADGSSRAASGGAVQTTDSAKATIGGAGALVAADNTNVANLGGTALKDSTQVGQGGKLTTGLDIGGSGNNITIGDTKAFESVVKNALDAVTAAGKSYSGTVSDLLAGNSAENQKTLAALSDFAKSSTGVGANDKLILLAGAAIVGIAYLATRK